MLFSNINEVKYVIQVNAATTFDRLAPHIQNAEREIIASAIGSPIYVKLQVFHDDSTKLKITSPTQSFNAYKSFDASKPAEVAEAYSILLWLTQHSLIHLTYYVGFDVLNTLITDGGFKRTESDSHKSLFKYQEDRIRDYYKNSGLNGIDTILEFLERNINVFTEFQAQLNTYKTHLIHSSRVFQAAYNIQESHLVFMALAPYIKSTEELILEKELGKENMQLIIDEAKKSTPTPKVAAILPLLRPVVAYYAIVELMRDSGAEITDKGLFFRGQKAISNSDLFLPTPEARINNLMIARTKTAEDYLQRLKNYMLANQWQMPYNPRNNAIHRDNTDKKIFVA